MNFLSLNIGLINLNSLLNKVSCVFNLLYSKNIDILAITETWLNSSITNSFLLIGRDYNLLRVDDPSQARKRGVCLYVKCDITATIVPANVPNTLAVSLPELNTLLVVTYRPPSLPELDNDALMHYIDSIAFGKDILLLGDFNLPTLKWTPDPTGTQPPLRRLDAAFLDVFTRNALYQAVKEPTH